MQDGYDQTLSGLLRKRAELAYEVEVTRTRWEDLGAALTAVDAAILVFDPAIRPSDMPARKRAPIAADTSATPVQRFLLDLLRRSGKPVRTLQAAEAVMLDRGLDPRNRVMATLIRKTCGDAFGRLRKAGHVTGARYGSGSELEWRLI